MTLRCLLQLVSAWTRRMTLSRCPAFDCSTCIVLSWCLLAHILCRQWNLQAQFCMYRFYVLGQPRTSTEQEAMSFVVGKCVLIHAVPVLRNPVTIFLSVPVYLYHNKTFHLNAMSIMHTMPIMHVCIVSFFLSNCRCSVKLLGLQYS